MIVPKFVASEAILHNDIESLLVLEDGLLLVIERRKILGEVLNHVLGAVAAGECASSDGIPDRLGVQLGKFGRQTNPVD